VRANNVKSESTGPNEARLRFQSSASNIGIVQFLMKTNGDLRAFLQSSLSWLLLLPRKRSLSLVKNPPVGFST